MFVEGKSRTVFFPSDSLIYGISCDGSKKFNIPTCEHMILGQLRMGACQAKNAPLLKHRLTFQNNMKSRRNIVENTYNTKNVHVQISKMAISDRP